MTVITKFARTCGIACSVLVASLFSTNSPQAQGSVPPEVRSVFEGKQITLAVPFGEGGGFDRVGRTFMRHFERHTGATSIIINETGAGGLLSVNNGYVANPNQFRLQMVNTVGAVAATLGKAPGVRFDLKKFEWIGSLSTEPDAIIVNPKGRFASISDLLAHNDNEKPVTFAASGPGDNLLINPIVLGAVFEFPHRVITGYASGAQAWLGVLRGEADAVVWAFSGGVPHVTSGEARLLGLVGDRPEPYKPERDLPDAYSSVPLADVPTALELAKQNGVSDRQMTILEAHLKARDGGRALAVAPGTDKERVQAYRQVFEAVLSDEKFMEDMEKQGLYLNPMFGEALQKHVAAIVDSPEEYKQMIRASYGN